MRLPALFLAALLSYGVRAQEISGNIHDAGGNPLAGATVALKNAKDSALIKLGVSMKDGRYVFVFIPPGRYFITVSHVGYGMTSSPAFPIGENSEFRVPVLQLNREAGVLRQAEVTAARPLLEVRPDRVIVHVADAINSTGEVALDLIRKSPGITVDNNNNISLDGKSGVQVYVDGRPTYLSGEELTEYLRALPSSSIESIDLISNPSAGYEAAGTAGIIDIRLKKDKSLGTSVTATAAYAIGTYSKYNAAISFNHRDRQLDFFGDISWLNAVTVYHSIYYRTELDTLFRQRDVLVTKANRQGWRLGLDYALGKRSALGVLFSGTLATDSSLTNSRTPIIYLPSNQTDRLLIADNRSSNLQDNYNFDLNYRFSGKGGTELDITGDYGLYHLRGNQLQPNNYFDSTGQHSLYSDTYSILSPTDIDIYSLKADYSRSALKGQLSAGVKFSYVTSANNYEEYNITNSVKIMDSVNSNQFNYRENINAAYINYNRRFGKGPELSAGLRVENTNGRGNSTGWQRAITTYTAYDSVFPRSYTDLFPNASLSWRAWTFSYSRRIDRPDYRDLNPFVVRVDDYIYSQGNTRLQPQYGNNISLAWSAAGAFSARLSYSHISDLFTSLTDTTDRSKSVNTMVNLAAQEVAGLNMTWSFRYKWYSAFIDVDGLYEHYFADFGPGKRIDENVLTGTIVSQHHFNLGKGWSADLSQYLSTPTIWEATLRSHTEWSLDAGLQKTLFDGRATVRTAVSDIFNTMPWAATSNFAGQYIYTAGDNETRRFKLSFTYRFGNTQVKAARQHQTGAEDEDSRVGNGGGTP